MWIGYVYSKFSLSEIKCKTIWQWQETISLFSALVGYEMYYYLQHSHKYKQAKAVIINVKQAHPVE